MGNRIMQTCIILLIRMRILGVGVNGMLAGVCALGEHGLQRLY